MPKRKLAQFAWGRSTQTPFEISLFRFLQFVIMSKGNLDSSISPRMDTSVYLPFPGFTIVQPGTFDLA